MVLTNCSNNYGPWQYPEKLIPVVMPRRPQGTYSSLRRWLEWRDWLYVDDHVDALLAAATQPARRELLRGGCGERNNRQVVEAICPYGSLRHTVSAAARSPR